MILYVLARFWEQIRPSLNWKKRFSFYNNVLTTRDSLLREFIKGPVMDLQQLLWNKRASTSGKIRSCLLQRLLKVKNLVGILLCIHMQGIKVNTWMILKHLSFNSQKSLSLSNFKERLIVLNLMMVTSWSLEKAMILYFGITVMKYLKVTAILGILINYHHTWYLL